jgi:hypothetical protein
MNYDATGLSTGSITDGGLQVNMADASNLTLNVRTNAGAGESQVMWMQKVGVTATNPGTTFVTVSSTASGAGADAETGVINFSTSHTDTGDVGQRADFSAVSTGGSAATRLGSIAMTSTTSGTGVGSTVVDSRAHLGEGEGGATQRGLRASATGAGSEATMSVSDGVSITANGDDAYAYISGLSAQGFTGGVANVDIGADVAMSSTARRSHAYVSGMASTDGSAGAEGNVHVSGELRLTSSGSEEAMARTAQHASGSGEIRIDGGIDLSATGPIATAQIQLMSTGQAELQTGNIDFVVNGSAAGRGWIDLYSDHAGGLSVGNVNINVAHVNSEATLFLQHENNSTSGIVDNTFLAHGSSSADVSIGTVNLSGAGFVDMYLDSMSIGTINRGSSLSSMDLRYTLADSDGGGLGAGTAATAVSGFAAAGDSIVFNGVAANGTNFANTGTAASVAELNAELNAALDGTVDYAFAVYTGAGDINGDGTADTNSGVLAWDADGDGISAVLLLAGNTSITAADLS